MEYEHLTDEEMEAMLSNRLRGYEVEHYNHVINLALLEATGAKDDSTKAAIQQSKNAIATLENAHRNTKAERDKVKARVAAKTPNADPQS